MEIEGDEVDEDETEEEPAAAEELQEDMLQLLDNDDAEPVEDSVPDPGEGGPDNGGVKH